MQIRPVIPVKLLPVGKSRLGGVLSPTERQGLTRFLLGRLLGVLAGVPGLGQPVVVSRDTAVAELIHPYATLFQEDPTADLNEALQETQAYLQATDSSSTHWLILPSDLPLIGGEDVAVLQGCDTAVGIVGNQQQDGTNALLLPLHTPFTLHFGPNSFQLHRQEAARRHLSYTCFNLPRLAFDIDTPQDWQIYKTLSSATHLEGASHL
jgi:2-phospho-L-lactate/phosphoenolpyruvate guanylyltransferase